MNDADELARRYLALWTEYLTAFLADPRALETTKRWIAFTGQFAYPAPGKAGAAGEGGDAPLPPLPPIFGPFGPLPMASPIAVATGEGSATIDELARRVEALEQRIATLERTTKPRPARRTRRKAAT
jgi:hypothetical protein